VMDEALAMYESKVTTGVNFSNRAQVEEHLRFERDLPRWRQEIVFDPQTSGGLLVALPAAEAEQALAALHEAGIIQACVIGDVLPHQGVELIFA